MSKEADEFWESVDQTLLEEEQALAEFREYLDSLPIEEAETAIHGLHEYLREVGHPPVERIVMGWERWALDD